MVIDYIYSYFSSLIGDQFQVKMMQLKEYHMLGVFPQRSYRKKLVYVPMTNFLFALEQESKQTKTNLKNCVYLWFLPVCK